MEQQNITHTAEQVAHLLRVPVGSVYRWIESGRLAAYRHGEIWRIRDKDLDAFIAPGGYASEPDED